MLQFTDQMSTSKIKETSSLNKSIPATTILMQSKHIYLPFLTHVMNHSLHENRRKTEKA